MGRDTAAAEAGLHDQTQLLQKRELLIVFGTMTAALFVAFLDQNGITVLLPSIARDLNAQSSITWAGTSALVANTIFQILYGRLSDLFGRKNILISALILLSLSDLVCGLSVNSTMLYIFRGLAGVAGGGITSLTMMIVSDIVTLQDRGKYQGILGAAVGLGNAVGPVLAASFDLVTWRGLFYLLAPLCMLTVIPSWRYLPTNMPKLNVRETLAKIDLLGLLTGTAAVILLLIPISQGGHDGYAWSSPEIVAMLCVGGVCFVAFLVVEWKFASLPMMPLAMFRSPSVSAMLAQSLLLGASYYSYIYFVPLYLQNVKRLSPIASAVMMLPLVVSQSITSTLAGLYISLYNRYGIVIWSGFFIWTLGSGLLIISDTQTNLGLFAFYLIIIGSGTGCTFQPTLVALQAQTPAIQRAVVTSNRNFLRSSGGAIGLAVSSAVLANTLKSALPADLADVANSSFAAPKLSHFSTEQQRLIVHGYALASRNVFIWCVPLTGICLVLCLFIRDRGLQRKEEIAQQSTQSSVETGEETQEKATSRVAQVHPVQERSTHVTDLDHDPCDEHHHGNDSDFGSITSTMPEKAG
ncbi:hypothetical protein AMS68_007676 [Peltaster fructicola]|uniref:Major facilitator superfamily (MFS) profile domain-containing protein n=1 Tax=Peltaster fructicola TaxID=286661 RepID=A0A6H0Y5Q0_9PEZI|nr:hypothetical protein AMS68_007676 [Peltaster fructicola]